MPELPEVETMVRGIRPHLERRKIRELRQCPCRCKPISLTPGFRTLASRMRGLTITSVRRLAKRVVLDLSDESVLAIEPRMTGLMLLADPPDPEHLRLGWKLDGAGEYDSVWFWDRRGLGTVRLYSAAEYTAALGSGRLGPDALTAELADWQRLCQSQRPIKVALLDQQRIAGIGNLYASEILHLARIHPERPASQLQPSEIAALVAATQSVLTEAIRYEGSTLSDGTYRNALNRDGGYQNAHRVYARADEFCPTCQTEVVQRIVQAQRSTFFCPRCQPITPRRKTRRPPLP